VSLKEEETPMSLEGEGAVCPFPSPSMAKTYHSLVVVIAIVIADEGDGEEEEEGAEEEEEEEEGKEEEEEVKHEALDPHKKSTREVKGAKGP